LFSSSSSSDLVDAVLLLNAHIVYVETQLFLVVEFNRLINHKVNHTVIKIHRKSGQPPVWWDFPGVKSYPAAFNAG